eukprot:435971-Karenia_brevis.AAC.1
MEIMPVHRRNHKRAAPFRRDSGASRALALAACNNVRYHSGDQRPPVSCAAMSRWHRLALTKSR